jgi:hypothetical protein
MKTSSLDREIRARIDALLTDISTLVKSSALEAVHAALGGISGGDPTPTAGLRRGPGRPRKGVSAPAAPKAARGGKRERRSSEDVQATADAFLAYVKANEGRRLEEIAQGMGRASKELKLPVIKLIQARAVRTEGRKRGTKYFAGGGSGKRGRRAKKA